MMAVDLLSMTTDIVSQYVSNNQVEMVDLSKIIRQVYSSLAELGGSPVASTDRPEPAVPIKKSIHDDHII